MFDSEIRGCSRSAYMNTVHPMARAGTFQLALALRRVKLALGVKKQISISNWKTPIQAILKRRLTRRAEELRAACQDPEPAQQGALERLIRLNGSSVIGREAGLDRARSLPDAKHLPQYVYADLRDSIDQIVRFGPGANGVFSRSPVRYIAKTSGTTSEPKRFPITTEYLRSYRRHMTLLIASVLTARDEWDQLLKGKQVALTARPFTGRTNGGVPEGFMSGLMSAGLPWWMRLRLLPSPRLMNLPSWNERMDAVIDEAARSDVRMIGGMPPLLLSFAERTLERLNLRALSEVWPRLRFLAFGGVPLSDRMRNRLTSLCGSLSADGPEFLELYAATEGHFGFTLDPSWPGMVFNPFENLYQFAEEGDGRVLQLHEIEKGGHYALLVTTPGGLVNYRIGDWIEVTSVRPVTFRVYGRDKDEISLATEKIIPDQVERAVGLAGQRCGFRLDDYVLWTEEGNPNRLVWGVAFAENVPDPDVLARTLDQSLRELNPSYDELRNEDFVYGPPRIEQLSPELFRDYRRRNLDRGQFKGKTVFRSRRDFEREYRPEP